MRFTAVLTLLALSCAQELPTKKPTKRSYVCPPNFIRLSHRCYYFSKEAATWQNAFFRCRDLHGNLAIVRNANQDKLIKRTLSKPALEPLGRWIGGMYDWEQMMWKWGASGKSLTYQGFKGMETDKEKLRWHCIFIDPQLHFRWNTASCLEEKQFICHTKIKIVTNKGKKKLLRQYNVNKYNKLNEIPVPILPEDSYNKTNLKNQQATKFHFEAYDVNAQYATVPREKIKRRKGKGKGRKNRRQNRKNLAADQYIRINGTDYNQLELKQIESNQSNRRRRNKLKEDEREPASMEKILWRSYYKDPPGNNPLYPRPIIEEYSFAKDSDNRQKK